MSNTSGSWVPYRYTPTLAGSCLFIILFFIETIVLMIQVGHYSIYLRNERAAIHASLDSDLNDEEVITNSLNKMEWKTSGKYVPLLIGCIMEFVGYIGRAISKKDVAKLGPYIVQAVLLLVAPALMAATIYMLFGRMLFIMQCTSISIVPSRFNTTIFVTGDLLSFLLQAAGGGLMSNATTNEIGSRIIIGGLFVQVLFFGLFVITEIRFTLTIYKHSPVVDKMSHTWKNINTTLLICSVLILVRSVVRLVEFFEGFSGYIMGHEWFLYVFDAVPMFLVALLFILSFSKGNPFKLEVELQRRMANEKLDNFD